MLYSLYTIYDRVAMEGGPVYQARNDNVAIRGFHQILEKDMVNQNDFRLYCVGSWDSDSMVCLALPAPREVFAPESVPMGQPEPIIGKAG